MVAMSRFRLNTYNARETGGRDALATMGDRVFFVSEYARYYFVHKFICERRIPTISIENGPLPAG
ncbi:MAG: hypothetical protein A2Z25_12290 [Planctomycetes bacterium RBG_16_55_9]|nr:MAG: hypothetical protein A2Z25_12290 [Planctomycetes bacterium RBG_16_55_9]